MIDIELQTIQSGYDRETCWVHARAGAIPVAEGPPVVVLTTHKLRITGDDVFYPICDLRTDDGGTTWTEPLEHSDAFARRPLDGGAEVGVCDFWPMWHAATGVLLGTGHTVIYEGDNIPPGHRPRSTIYSIYDPEARSWAPWKKLENKVEFDIDNEGAGSTQRVDLPNGEILLPSYYTKESVHMHHVQLASTVMRCGFDGKTLTFLERGTEHTVKGGRGMGEPSLAYFDDRYFLTLRNDDCGYVTRGSDGLHFDPTRKWTFDDGSDLGNYNTQQHWLTMPDGLFLIYTRRGANNDHVVRHRAPLFIAQVDTERLCVIRDTEQVLVPERGARLGNFGVTKISDIESWVTVAEWMQTLPPDYADCRVCEQYGSDNSVFLAKVRSRG